MKKKRDPRIDERLLAALEGGTIADALFMRGLRRSVYLEQYKHGEVRRFVSFLNSQVFPDLLDRLEARLRRIEDRGFDTGLDTTERLKRLATELRGVLAGGIHAGSEDLRERMKKLAVSEGQWQAAVLQQTVPLQVVMQEANVRLLQSIVDDRPFAGAVLKKWTETLTTQTQQRVERAINVGLAQGETSEQIVRRLRGTRALLFQDGVLHATRNEAAMVVRTAVGHISAHAREATGEANADIIKGMRWVSALDPSTCLICANLDGEVFPLGEGQRPPAHPRCRCGVVPKLKTWRELGLNVRDAPPGARAAFGGPVRGDMKYSDWFDEQSAAVKEQILGPGRAALIRAGEAELSDLVNNQGRILTLEQLDALGA